MAEWLEQALGIEIPELGYAWSESLPYGQMAANTGKQPGYKFKPKAKLKAAQASAQLNFNLKGRSRQANHTDLGRETIVYDSTGRSTANLTRSSSPGGARLW